MGKRAGQFRARGGHKKIKQEWHNTEIPTQNELFKAYYQLQLSLPQAQFQQFWAMMKERLPVVFRINSSLPNYQGFLQKVQSKDFINGLLKDIESGSIKAQNQNKSKQMQIEAKEEGADIPSLQILDWYPNHTVHQLSTSKQAFKKTPALSALHSYLQKSFDSGLISRQELVSMLPPLYLQIEPNDLVLDMCAAPGSKTSQMLQMIYKEGRGFGMGGVIANDADYSRAQMLIHQINRVGTAGMAVVNHPGQFMPQLWNAGKNNQIKKKFQFDKVLCDVPCSGDGATRKLPIKWAKWHPSDGIALHPLQLAIFMKAINLLKRGGLIVYSTCSLNPMENEAVLSALMKKVGKGLTIVDIHGKFGVKGRRGLEKWVVAGVEYEGEKGERKRKLKIFESFEECKGMHKIKQSMFPPSQEEAEVMGLRNSMRVLPHDQNTGGFFIALLRKEQDFEWKYAVNNKATTNLSLEEQQQKFVDENLPQVENAVVEQTNQRKKYEKNEEKEEERDEEKYQNQDQNEKEQEQGIQKEEIIQEKEQNQPKGDKNQVKQSKFKKGSKYEKFQQIQESQWASLQQFYGLPADIKELLFIRNIPGTASRKVLLISRGIKSYLQADTTNKIKLINMGCRVFEKGKESFAGHQCLYRLAQQGVHFLLPALGKRKVKVTLALFIQLISVQSLLHQNIPDQSVREQIKSMSQGSFCLYIDEQIHGKRVVDAMVGQNFKNSLHLLVGREEHASLNFRYL